MLRVLGDKHATPHPGTTRSGTPAGGRRRDLPVSRSAASQHLKVLKEAHLVSDRAIGTRRVLTTSTKQA